MSRNAPRNGGVVDRMATYHLMRQAVTKLLIRRCQMNLTNYWIQINIIIVLIIIGLMIGVCNIPACQLCLAGAH